MVLRYLTKLFQSDLRRNPYRKKKRQKKSFFIYGTTFKKNESGRDFQRGQIWNNRSQKQKKDYGRHPVIIFLFYFVCRDADRTTPQKRTIGRLISEYVDR
jgi:hypothetical protein